MNQTIKSFHRCFSAFIMGRFIIIHTLMDSWYGFLMGGFFALVWMEK